jgi:hypothetical protein
MNRAVRAIGILGLAVVGGVLLTWTIALVVGGDPFLMAPFTALWLGIAIVVTASPPNPRIARAFIFGNAFIVLGLVLAQLVAIGVVIVRPGDLDAPTAVARVATPVLVFGGLLGGIAIGFRSGARAAADH